MQTAEQKHDSFVRQATHLIGKLEELFEEMPSKGDTEETCQRQCILNKIKQLEQAVSGMEVSDFEAFEGSDSFRLTDPDLQQYGRKVSEGVYEFKELARGMDDYETGEFVELTITMADYTPEKIAEHISAYYSSVEEIEATYGDDWEFIVAECIFEQESGLY